AKPVGQNTNVAALTTTPEKAQTAIAHSAENQQPTPVAPSNGQSKWTQSGDPIDTKEFDSAIMSAEKALSTKPADAAAKKHLADAYLKRAMALTDARQNASALGDYRRTIKYDPSNTEAKNWIDQIISIYTSINRSYPAEGEEPPPLPFKS
ncbi:MAG: hypothetical protein ABIV48_00140, partial [Pyrinomonadaceae bacterium]